MASVGAWFCVQNTVSPIVFADFLSSFSPVGSPRYNLTILNPDFDIERFARALEEPIGVVRTLRFENLDLGQIQRAARVSGPSASPIRTCPLCTIERYHSVWHQLPWLDRCTFHNAQLMDVPRYLRHRQYPRQVGPDLRGIPALIEDWFGRNSSNQTWKEQLGRRRRKVGSRLCREIATISSDLEIGRHAYADPLRTDLAHVRYVGVQGGPSLVSALELAGLEVGWSDLVGLADDESRRDVIIQMDPGLSVALVASSGQQVESLFDLRRLTCHVRGEKPAWLLQEQHTIETLLAGHHQCLEQVEQFFRDGSIDRRAPYWCESVEEPLIRLASTGLVVCPHLVAIDLLDRYASPRRAFDRITGPIKKGVVSQLQWPNSYYRRPDSPLRDQSTQIPFPTCPATHLVLSDETASRLIDWRQNVAPFDGLVLDGIGVPSGAVAKVVDEWMLIHAAIRHEVVSSRPSAWASICASSGAIALFGEYERAVEDCRFRSTMNCCESGLRIRSAWKLPVNMRDESEPPEDLDGHLRKTVESFNDIDRFFLDCRTHVRKICCGTAHAHGSLRGR
jgi:hypothetical protein